MKVPFLDLTATYTELKEEINAAMQRVTSSGTYILGEEVDVFENEWASYCGSKYSVGVASGLDALILALKALDIGLGDEVIVPTHTFIATWLAVSAVGANIIPIDCSHGSYNAGIESIIAAYSDRTKAIIVVHLYGIPVDLDPIVEFASRNNLNIIEDAAQAHGAMYKGRRIGSHGDITCWSFYPGKNLGAFGDAGALTTDSYELATKLRMLRNYGSRKKYVHELMGTNSRLDPIQAAVLRIKLTRLDEWNLRRKQIAQFYLENIDQHRYKLPTGIGSSSPSWHLFVIQSRMRDDVISHLEAKGVSALIHYPTPCHKQQVYFPEFGLLSLPLANQLCKNILSLPIGPHLDMEEVQYVVEALNSWFPSS